MSIAFREARRNYGVRVPVEDVPAHLACGWKVADPFDDRAPDGALLLRPPRLPRDAERRPWLIEPLQIQDDGR